MVKARYKSELVGKDKNQFIKDLENIDTEKTANLFFTKAKTLQEAEQRLHLVEQQMTQIKKNFYQYDPNISLFSACLEKENFLLKQQIEKANKYYIAAQYWSSINNYKQQLASVPTTLADYELLKDMLKNSIKATKVASEAQDIFDDVELINQAEQIREINNIYAPLVIDISPLISESKNKKKLSSDDAKILKNVNYDIKKLLNNEKLNLASLTKINQQTQQLKNNIKKSKLSIFQKLSFKANFEEYKPKISTDLKLKNFTQAAKGATLRLNKVIEKYESLADNKAKKEKPIDLKNNFKISSFKNACIRQLKQAIVQEAVNSEITVTESNYGSIATSALKNLVDSIKLGSILGIAGKSADYLIERENKKKKQQGQKVIDFFMRWQEDALKKHIEPGIDIICSEYKNAINSLEPQFIEDFAHDFASIFINSIKDDSLIRSVEPKDAIAIAFKNHKDVHKVKKKRIDIGKDIKASTDGLRRRSPAIFKDNVSKRELSVSKDEIAKDKYPHRKPASILQAAMSADLESKEAIELRFIEEFTHSLMVKIGLNQADSNENKKIDKIFKLQGKWEVIDAVFNGNEEIANNKLRVKQFKDTAKLVFHHYEDTIMNLKNGASQSEIKKMADLMTSYIVDGVDKDFHKWRDNQRFITQKKLSVESKVMHLIHYGTRTRNKIDLTFKDGKKVKSDFILNYNSPYNIEHIKQDNPRSLSFENKFSEEFSKVLKNKDALQKIYNQENIQNSAKLLSTRYQKRLIRLDRPSCETAGQVAAQRAIGFLSKKAIEKPLKYSSPVRMVLIGAEQGKGVKKPLKVVGEKLSIGKTWSTKDSFYKNSTPEKNAKYGGALPSIDTVIAENEAIFKGQNKPKKDLRTGKASAIAGAGAAITEVALEIAGTDGLIEIGQNMLAADASIAAISTAAITAGGITAYKATKPIIGKFTKKAVESQQSGGLVLGGY